VGWMECQLPTSPSAHEAVLRAFFFLCPVWVCVALQLSVCCRSTACTRTPTTLSFWPFSCGPARPACAPFVPSYLLCLLASVAVRKHRKYL